MTKKSDAPAIRFKGFSDAWEQRKLSELTSMHARIGWQNLRTSEFLDSGNYMLITGTDFNDGAINFSTCHYVERERYEQDRNIQIHNGSILITKTEHSEKWRMFRGCQCLQHLMQGYSMSKLRTQIMLMRSIFFNT